LLTITLVVCIAIAADVLWRNWRSPAPQSPTQEQAQGDEQLPLALDA
jgi:hypothetical protein